MEYTVFKLSFSTPVHFGAGRLSSSSKTIFADTLFSAFCQEAKKLYGEEGIKELCEKVNNNELLISDTMPYLGNTLFIPKPIIHINAQNKGRTEDKKGFKALNYIPIEDLSDYMGGFYTPQKAVSLSKQLGVEQIEAKVKVNFDKDNEPYNVGTFRFKEGAGIYFIVKASEDALNLVFDIMDSLSYSGIGGKISSGYGKFSFVECCLPQVFRDRFEKAYSINMTLSLAMAEENELEGALNGASYEIVKRSGFVASIDYAQNSLKKKDFYCFKGGSCFENSFSGNIFDVSVNGGHSVYRYAKPMFLGLI